MHIKLHNFRTHIDKEFDIPDEGLVLLVGESGAGKSTLLLSILYALYGKVKKPYSHGKNTCKVELEYMGMTIVRSSRPNRLLVDIDDVRYEDDVAQGAIHKVMSMNVHEFLASSFIMQRIDSSVLSMTSSEQSKFIEILANTKSKDHREAIKVRAKEVSDEKQRKIGEKNSLEMQINKLQEKYADIPEVPEEIRSGLSPDKLRQDLEEKEEALQEYHTNLESLRIRLEKVRTEEKTKKESQDKISKLEAKIETLTSLKKELPQVKEKEDIDALEEECREKEEMLEQSEAYNSYQKEIDEMNERIQEYRETLENRKKELEMEILSEDDIHLLNDEYEKTKVDHESYIVEKASYDEAKKKKEKARGTLADLKGLFPEASSYSKGKQIISFLEKKISSLQKERKRCSISKKYKCPHCEGFVSFFDDKLLKFSSKDESNGDEDRDKLERLDVQRQFLSDKLLQVQEQTKILNTKLYPLRKEPPDPSILLKKSAIETRKRDEYEQIIKKLESRELPLTLSRKKIAIEEREENFTNIEIDDNLLKEDIDSLRNSLEKEMQNIMSANSYSKDIEDMKESIDKLLSSSKTSKVSSSSLETKVSDLTLSISNTTSEGTSIRAILSNISDYEEYSKHLETLDEFGVQLSTVEDELKEFDESLEGLYGLEEACREAEILAMEETVRSINEHAKIYLSRMFADEIIVKLETVKDVKLQLNTSIEYHGDEYTSIDELSGGERQRCDLAFLLAVHDMLGSNILLLDECLNNLDSTINTDVLSFLKEMSENKLILVVSHEAISGVFDEEVLIS